MLPAPSTRRLADVHVGIAPSRVKGGTQHLVQGSYLYYHYMQVTTGIGHHLRGGWGENGLPCPWCSSTAVPASGGEGGPAPESVVLGSASFSQPA